MILLNGTVQSHIEISDRGLQYGDGLFETISIRHSKPIFLKQHLQRLYQSCQRLKIPVPDSRVLHAEIQQLCQNAEKAVLKIIITRGSGGRGYRQPDNIQSTRILSLHSFPEYPVSYAEQGIIARFCDMRLGLNPALAGMKHLNRLEQVLARAEWIDNTIAEGIMLDINNKVIEGTMTNLFYRKNQQLYTAKLTQSGIAGIIRTMIMARELVIEHSFTQAELLAADEIFVCNSIIGIWSITQLANQTFIISRETKQLQHWLNQRALQDD